MARRSVANVESEYYFPRGFTITDNRIEDYLQRHITPSAYVVWRQYLRYWGSDKKTAYPSLALLSERTGLSEKTIRKANHELVKKGYLRYSSGNSKRANSYYHIPIEDIIAKYEKLEASTNAGQEDSEGADENVPPIREYNKQQKDKASKELNKLDSSDRAIAEAFIDAFRDAYYQTYNIRYPLEARDVREVALNIEDLKSNFQTYKSLLTQFMKSRSQYIAESDHSLFLFFRPKIIKTLMSEFSQTDIGRWIHQSQKIVEELKQEIEEEQPEDLKKYLEERVKTYLTGASKQRDQFVEDYINRELSS